MIEIRETEQFSAWLAKLRDQEAKARIAVRIRRLAFGNAGDVVPIGGGLSELRIHYGAGYRVYFIRKESDLILLLAGGDKSGQREDIRQAKILAKQLKD